MATKTSSPDLPRVPRFASPDDAARSAQVNGADGGLEEISTSTLRVEEEIPGLPPVPGLPPIPSGRDPDRTLPFEGDDGDVPPEATVMISAMAEEPSFAAPEPEPLPAPKSIPAPKPRGSTPPKHSATVTMDAVTPRGPKGKAHRPARTPTSPPNAKPTYSATVTMDAITPRGPKPRESAPQAPAPSVQDPIEAARIISAIPESAPPSKAPVVEDPIEATRMLSALPDAPPRSALVASEPPIESTVMMTSPLGAAIDAVNAEPATGSGRDLSGDLVGERYRLLKPLGQGAVGVVYKAEHTLMKKPVAVKVLHPATSRHPSVTERFVAEARALAKIAHRHVCAATDFGQTDDGEFYLVMEFLSGRTLAELMGKQGRVAPDRAVFIVEQMCAGLAACHKLGIVHRDLKPENVMLVEADGYPDCVKLFDFGIAHVSRGDSGSRADAVMGTVEYMAPEQALGDAVDARTDLYSLGVMLYELLTGRLPFEDADPLEVLRRHIEQAPPLMSTVAPHAGIPPALEEVVQQLLAKRPSDRIQTADELKARLGQVWAAGAVAPTSGGFWSNASLGLKAALVGLPILALVIGLAFMGGDDGSAGGTEGDGTALGLASTDGADKEVDNEEPENPPSQEGDASLGTASAGEPQADVSAAGKTAAQGTGPDATSADEGSAESPAPGRPPAADAGSSAVAAPDGGATDTASENSTDVAPATTANTPDAGSVVPASPPSPDGALPDAETVVAKLPGADLALANLKNGNAAAALGQLQTLALKHPSDPHLHFLVGQASSATSNDALALTSYRKALELEPRYATKQTLVDTVFAFIDLPSDPTTKAGLALLKDKLASTHGQRLAKIALTSGRAESRERALSLLQDSGGLTKLKAWQQRAIALRAAVSCEARKPHVIALGALGDKAALPLLSTLASSRRGCGATGGDDCHQCMRSELDAIVATLSK